MLWHLRQYVGLTLSHLEFSRLTFRSATDLPYSSRTWSNASVLDDSGTSSVQNSPSAPTTIQGSGHMLCARADASLSPSRTSSSQSLKTSKPFPQAPSSSSCFCRSNLSFCVPTRRPLRHRPLPQRRFPVLGYVSCLARKRSQRIGDGRKEINSVRDWAAAHELEL